MKRIKLKLLAIALIIFPMILSAQDSSIESIFDDYYGEDGFKSINISKDMFMLMAQLEGSFESEEFDELQNAVSGLNGMKIISYENPYDETGKKFRTQIDDILEKGKFVELMTIKEEKTDAHFMLRKDGNDIIELLLVADEKDQLTVISFFGLIDLKAISKLSKSVKIKGMEKFENIGEDY